MTEPRKDLSVMTWKYQEGDRRFEATILTVEAAYSWMLQKITEARRLRDMEMIVAEIPVQIEPLPRIEDAVRILAHDKWNVRSLNESLNDWLTETPHHPT